MKIEIDFSEAVEDYVKTYRSNTFSKCPDYECLEYIRELLKVIMIESEIEIAKEIIKNYPEYFDPADPRPTWEEVRRLLQAEQQNFQNIQWDGQRACTGFLVEDRAVRALLIKLGMIKE